MQLPAVFDEVATEGFQLFSRKLLHKDLRNAVLCGFAARLLTLLETGITRRVHFQHVIH